MSKIRYEIPGIVGLVCIVLSSGQISQTGVRIGISSVCIIGTIILSYFVMREFETIIKKSIDSRDMATKETMEAFKNIIEKYNEEQCAKMEQMNSLVVELNTTTTKYSQRVDSLAEIQTEIIKEQHRLNEGNEKIKTVIIAHYSEEKLLFEESMKQYKETMESFKNTIEKYNEEQYAKMEQMNSLIVTLNTTTAEYSGRVDSLAEIQTEIIKEQHRLNEGNEKIKTVIIDHYSEEKLLFEESMKQYKETMEVFKNTIEKYNEEQCANMEQLNLLVVEFNTTTMEYSRRVDLLAEIQTEIINEQHRLNEGNEKIKTIIIDRYSEEKMLFEESINKFKETSIDNANKQLKTINDSFEYVNNILKELEKSMFQELDAFKEKYIEIAERAISEENKYLTKFNDNIEEYLTNYGNTINESNETLRALKATVQTNLDAIKATVGKQASDVNDGLEDCSDALNDGLDKFSKQQKARDEEQNNKLNESVGTIEKVISEQVGAVLEENKKLLSYIQNIQEEWTTLSRNEIDFLSKVWDE